MAEENENPTPEQAEGASKQSENNTSEPKQVTDWQEKYEELLKHSREWEKRAKANYEAVSQLEELKQQNDELGKRAAQAEELQKKLDDIESQAKLADLKKQVSEDTGVPADLLPDGDEDTMRAWAEKLANWDSKRPRLPISDQSKTPTREPKDDGLHVMARQFNK